MYLARRPSSYSPEIGLANVVNYAYLLDATEWVYLDDHHTSLPQFNKGRRAVWNQLQHNLMVRHLTSLRLRDMIILKPQTGSIGSANLMCPT